MTPKKPSMKDDLNVWNLKGWKCPRCGRGWSHVWCLDVNHIDSTACFVIECSGEDAHLCHATLSLNESDEP